MKVSVALCTYNGEKYLAEQLDSILSQGLPVDEIIVCDDCSQDGTADLLKCLAEKKPQLFRLYFNEKNIGVIKNFEQALSLCTGDIIFLSDQDDIWKINKVEKCVEFLRANPNAYGVVTDAEIIEESGAPAGKTLSGLLGLQPVKKNMQPVEFFRFMLLYGNMLAGNCLAITRKAIDIIFPFRYIEGMWHDEWIAMKLAERNKIYFLDETLTKYRMHGDQQTKWLWSGREEKNKKRNSFMQKQANLFPLDYYKYWANRAATVQTLSANGFSIDKSIFKEISAERKRGLLSYLKTNPFLKKKWKLFKLWLKRDENISLYNFFIE